MHSICQLIETRLPRTLIGPRGNWYSKVRWPVAESGVQSSVKTFSESSVPFPDVVQETSTVIFEGVELNSHSTAHFKSSPGRYMDFFNSICNDIFQLRSIKLKELVPRSKAPRLRLGTHCTRGSAAPPPYHIPSLFPTSNQHKHQSAPLHLHSCVH